MTPERAAALFRHMGENDMGIRKLTDAFAFKGNVIDMAVGVMIGGAFGKITTSLVNDIFMPLLSLVMGKVNVADWFVALDGNTYATAAAAAEAGAPVFRYGAFLSTVIDFFLIAMCVFIFVKLVGRLRRKKPEAPKAPPAPVRKCPYCMSEVDPEATRCPHCTSMLTDEGV